ncbi:aspartyl protease family protein [Paraneptunicella aestuarii]|nr:aspartyl protease family protein [Paraneptunicella aestuarii]
MSPNGNLVAPVYRFSSLSIGNSYVDDIAIVVLPLENMDSDGLLGMNFLRAFRFEIDQAQDMLILAPNKA